MAQNIGDLQLNLYFSRDSTSKRITHFRLNTRIRCRHRLENTLFTTYRFGFISSSHIVLCSEKYIKHKTIQKTTEMPINRIDPHLTLGFFANPPPVLPFGFVSVVAVVLRFRPLLVATGLSDFFAMGVVVFTFLETEKNVSSRPC